MTWWFDGQVAVGRVEVDPAGSGRPHRAPRVRCVGADEPGPAGRREGLDVAAHVARRQSDRPQAPHREVGEVLAHTAARREHARQRRRHVGEPGVELERLEDVAAQRVGRRRRSTATGRERPRGDAAQRDAEIVQVDERRRRPEEAGVDRDRRRRRRRAGRPPLPRRVVDGYRVGRPDRPCSSAMIVTARWSSCRPNWWTRLPNASTYESASEGGGSSVTVASLTRCQGVGRGTRQATVYPSVIGRPVPVRGAVHDAVARRSSRRHRPIRRCRRSAASGSATPATRTSARRRACRAPRSPHAPPAAARRSGSARVARARSATSTPAAHSPSSACRRSRSIAVASERGLLSSCSSSAIAASRSTSLR